MFNRPHKAAQVFEKVRQVRPSKLFIAIDGPRPDHPGEAEKVQQCRAFKDKVDWDCDVKTNFSEKNLRCRDRIASAITWTFEYVDEIIILEDDCVPDLSFFRFCAELLEKYRDDDRIATIGGYNCDHCEPFEESYAFSKVFTEWGWATWKRAWNHFDITMHQWLAFKQDKYFKNIFIDTERFHTESDWKKQLQFVYDHIDFTWDHIFLLNCLANHALHIVPKINLVHNTGFDNGGQHQQRPLFWNLYMDEAIDFPLVHPDIISPIDKLYGPPIIPDTPENQGRILRTLTDNETTLNQLFKLKQYQAVIIFFKEIILKDRIVPIGFNLAKATLLALHYVNIACLVAMAYFNLGDLEHAEAMTDIVLAITPKSVDVLIFRLQIFMRQGDFDKIQSTVETLSKLDADKFTAEQAATFTKLLEALGAND